MMKRITILLFALTALAGCSFLKIPKTSVISKEQIDFDLFGGGETYKLKGNKVKERDSDFEGHVFYNKDDLRCFAPSGDEDKVTDSTADIYLNIGAEKWTAGDAEFVYGKIILHYKKENDKWRLEDIDSKDLRTDKIPGKMSTEIRKFVDQKIDPLCTYYGIAPK